MAKKKLISYLWLAIFLGLGVILAMGYEIVYRTQDRTPPGLNPVQKDYLESETAGALELLKGPIQRYWLDHQHFPQDLKDLVQAELIEPQQLRDPFQHEIRWEERPGEIALRSAGWDRIFYTADDIMLFVPRIESLGF